MAVETLSQGPELVYPTQLTGGSLSVYLEAIHIALFGKSLLGLRALNGLINVGLVVATYALTRLVFANQGKLFSQLIATLTSVWLASSIWLLAVGRIAFTNVALTPLMTVGCFYALWSGLQAAHRRHFALAGVILGLSLYGYTAAVSVPVVIAAFIIGEWLISRLDRRPSLVSKYWRQMAYLVGATIVVASPLVIYYALAPDVLLSRPMEVAMANESFVGQRLLGTVGDTFASFGLLPTWLISRRLDRLVFNPPTAVLFSLGVLVAIRRLRQPAYLFLLAWWTVALLPAILSVAASVWVFDLMRRAINSQPVSFIFPALAVVSAGRWLQGRRLHGVSFATAVIAAAILTYSGIHSYKFFFVDWISRPETQGLFDKEPMELTEWLTANSTPDMAYVFPLRPEASPNTRPELFTVRTYYEGRAQIAYPVLDEATLPEALTDLSAGKSDIKVMLPNRTNVDPKGYLDFLLGQHATQTASQSRFGYTIKTYRLESAYEKFSAPASVVSADIDFGQAMRLVDYAASSIILPAGETIWLTLHWTKLEDTDRDYSISLSLVDSKGYAFATVDKPLLNNVRHETTSHWAIGETATDYYTLPVPAHTPPGDYILQVVVYDAAGERLVPASGKIDLTSPLAEITVIPATLPIEPKSLAIGTPVEMPVAADLRVIGMELSHPATARPGDHVLVSLVWQATKTPRQNYELAMGLIGEEGQAHATAPQPLVSASFPTSQWRRGEILKTHHTLLLPPDLESGNYSLAMRLLDSETGSIASEQVLQPLAVEARSHTFAIPNPSRLLNVDFGTAVRLVGYDQPFVSEGKHLNVQLYWQALAEMSESYKVFAHLIDSDDTIIAQSDFVPGGGVAPTTSWVSGEIITDTIQVSLPETAPNSTFQLVIGLYNSVSGVRLPVSPGVGKEDTLVLPEIISGK
jgi:hypothetical protein